MVKGVLHSQARSYDARVLQTHAVLFGNTLPQVCTMAGRAGKHLGGSPSFPPRGQARQAKPIYFCVPLQAQVAYCPATRCSGMLLMIRGLHSSYSVLNLSTWGLPIIFAPINAELVSCAQQVRGSESYLHTSARNVLLLYIAMGGLNNTHGEDVQIIYDKV
jgi:hypothetical protein